MFKEGKDFINKIRVIIPGISTAGMIASVRETGLKKIWPDSFQEYLIDFQKWIGQKESLVFNDFDGELPFPDNLIIRRIGKS